MHCQNTFIPLNIAILTVSDTRTLETDTSGAWLKQAVEEAGHCIHARSICQDDPHHIRAQVSQWIIDKSVQVILITGGTGFYQRDNTPEAVTVLFDKTVDGFGELFRQYSVEEIGTAAIQSRAVAGLANRTLIACLPGSGNACRTAWEKILKPQLDGRTRPCNFIAHLKECA